MRGDPLLTVMVRAVRAAARILIRDFGEVENLQAAQKGLGDFVTESDKAAENSLRESLGKARGDFGFLLEEGGAIEGTDPSSRWLVDPLDGTLNFMHGVPHFAISVAAEVKGELMAGVIYDPIKDELFYASKGGGAFINETRLSVSKRQTLTSALLSYGVKPGGEERTLKEVGELAPRTAGIRRFGAAALDLAWVAAGRSDGFWERDLHPWDLAAGTLLVREAGGFAKGLKGDDPVAEGAVVAANPQLFPLLRRVIAESRHDPVGKHL